MGMPSQVCEENHSLSFWYDENHSSYCYPFAVIKTPGKALSTGDTVGIKVVA